MGLAWRGLCCTLMLALCIVGPKVASAGDPDPAPVLGRWLSADGKGVFEIVRCPDGTVCGRLAGMSYDGPVPLDYYKRPQCDMMLLRGFKPSGDDDGHWDGSIYDPDDGHTYQASIWSPDPGTLNLRGYLMLPILGRTERWTRFRGTIGAACKFHD